MLQMEFKNKCLKDIAENLMPRPQIDTYQSITNSLKKTLFPSTGICYFTKIIRKSTASEAMWRSY